MWRLHVAPRETSRVPEQAAAFSCKAVVSAVIPQPVSALFHPCLTPLSLTLTSLGLHSPWSITGKVLPQAPF